MVCLKVVKLSFLDSKFFRPSICVVSAIYNTLSIFPFKELDLICGVCVVADIEGGVATGSQVKADVPIIGAHQVSAEPSCVPIPLPKLGPVHCTPVKGLDPVVCGGGAQVCGWFVPLPLGTDPHFVLEASGPSIRAAHISLGRGLTGQLLIVDVHDLTLGASDLHLGGLTIGIKAVPLDLQEGPSLNAAHIR